MQWNSVVFLASMHSAQVLAPTQSVAKENVFMIQKVDVKKKKTKTSKTIIITLLVRLQTRRPKQKDSEIIFPVFLEMKKFTSIITLTFLGTKNNGSVISNKTFVDVHCIVRVKGAKYLP